MQSNSVVGRFDGIVSYTDGSWNSFHASIERSDASQIWTFNLAESQAAIKQLNDGSTYYAAVTSLFSQLPFITSFSWSNTAVADKVINDVVLHFYLLVAFDDGTSYPVSITYEKGEFRYHTSTATDEISLATDKATILSDIEDLLEEIMTAVTIS
jgi:hypothetical protein